MSGEERNYKLTRNRSNSFKAVQCLSGSNHAAGTVQEEADTSLYKHCPT